MPVVRQYALAYFCDRIGPWRASRKEVLQDALQRGDASRDRESRRIYLTVPAEIIERRVQMIATADNVVRLRTRPHFHVAN